MLQHQTATLLVAAATLVLTILLYIIVPKGFFPVQDTGVIQGISEARAEHFVPGHGASGSRRWPQVILKDPAVESLSSFIGVDGINTTLNSGRILINLKPLAERKISASDVMRRLQPQTGEGGGHHALHAAGAGPDGGRPRQPHAISIHARRSERGRVEHLDSEVDGETARRCPQLRDVATDQQTRGSQAKLVIDRVTASRLGITPQAIDNTLYDAFGQRQISTLFTQLNQYHVDSGNAAGVPAQSVKVARHLCALGQRRRRCR